MQKKLFEIAKFPSTRYQGSKLKFVNWIWDCIKDIQFESALDAFGGTGAVAYRLKQANKKVRYNDILKFNAVIAKAILENDSVLLDGYEVDHLLKNENHSHDLISKHFFDIYYTEDENRWLDQTIGSIRKISDKYKQSIAYFALFQACIAKRPFNLFHRKNLYIRTQDVERSFGNKTTWDTPFDVHFRNFVNEANDAVFSGKFKCSVDCRDVFEIENEFDLVYIDPPYISEKGASVDYHHFYHFLEGIADYERWEKRINFASKHKRLHSMESDWIKQDRIENAFMRLFEKFKDSILVVSYRSDGIPSIDNLLKMLNCLGKKTEVFRSKDVKYVLSVKNTAEILIVAQ